MSNVEFVFNKKMNLTNYGYKEFDIKDTFKFIYRRLKWTSIEYNQD